MIVENVVNHEIISINKNSIYDNNIDILTE